MQFQANITHTQTFEVVLAELDALAAPVCVDPSVYTQLKAALKSALIVKGQEKTTDTPPMGNINVITDFSAIENGDGTINLTWSYYNLGDYDQDGVVSVTDITPLALNYMLTYSGSDHSSLLSVIDGSGNGIIDISDITPIAANFGVSVAAYRIESSAELNGTYTSVQEVPVGSGLDPATRRMSFSVQISSTPGYWYRIVPLDVNSVSGMPTNSIQANTSTWTHTWGGPSGEEATALEIDIQGNVLVSGYSNSYGVGAPDVLLLKYSPAGSLIWQRYWGGSNVDSANAIETDSSGNVFLAGVTYSCGAGDADVFLLKFSSDGNLAWQKTWGGTGFECANAVDTDSSGNVYLSGVTNSFGSGSFDALILQYSPAGELVWQKAWGSSFDDRSTSLSVGANDNIYVAGTTRGMRAQYIDTFLLNCSGDGSILWQRIWGSRNLDEVTALSIDNSGNVFLAGSTEKIYQKETDALLIKYSPGGTVLWAKAWGGADYERLKAICVDSSGNVSAGGTVDSGTGLVALLLKYSGEGNPLSQRLWGGENGNWAAALTMDRAGMLMMTGVSPNVSYGNWSIPTGSDWVFEGIQRSAEGIVIDLDGIDSESNGSVTLHEGTIDSGGGGQDMLLMQIDTSEW